MREAVSWNQVQFLSRCKCSQLILGDLAVPGRIVWPQDEGELLRSRQDMGDFLDDRGRELLDLSLLTSVLLDNDRFWKPVPAWAQLILDERRFFPGIELRELLKGRWTALPVVTVNPQAADIIYFVVGALEPGRHEGKRPAWMASRLAPETAVAIKDGFAAAKRLCKRSASLYAYPLSKRDYAPVTGRSLGLPVALGALTTMTGQPISRHLFATGDIQPEDGRIVRVSEDAGDIASKAGGGLVAGYRLFLYPTENQPVPDLPEDLEAKAVSNLEQAWLWARLYHPGQSMELNRLEVALRDPRGFVDNCRSIPPQFIQKCFHMESERMEQLLTGIRGNMGLVQDLIKQLESCLVGERRNLGQAQALSELIPRDGICGAGFTTLNAFRWCSSNLTLANHSGNLKQAAAWKKDAIRFEGDAKKADMREFCKFVNRQNVDELHNTYTFHPALPMQFQEILERQEKIYELMDSADYLMGALYGTVAQNYGFCGPEYLEQTKDFVNKAQIAFGAGKAEEYLGHWLRQFNYLFYAFMDAGRYKEAAEALRRCLGVENWQEAGNIIWKLDIFRLAALVRYLADSSLEPFFATQTDELSAIASRIIEDFPTQDLPSNPEDIHPWQLVTYNIGRCALKLDRPDAARKFWITSAGLCRMGGETIQVMGLLPLSALDATGNLTSELKGHVKEIKSLLETTTRFCRDHFIDVVNLETSADILDYVRRSPHRLFPFSHR